MLTIQDLLVNTPPQVRQKSKKVRAEISSVKKVQSKDKSYLEFTLKGKAITDKVYYNLTIRIFTTRRGKSGDVAEYNSVGKFSPVWVRCTCPYFQFFVEWVLAQTENTDLRKITDNKPPNIRNPDRIPYVCKHLFKALPLAVEAAKGIP